MAGSVGSRPLHGKVALITGAGRGIGRATSIGLAAAGATVGLLARSVDELEEVEKVVTGHGGVAIVCPADVGDRQQLSRMAATLTSEVGQVDIPVNNAAVVWPLAATTSVDPADWAMAMSVNLVGVFTLTSLLLPAMLTRGWGRIVNVSSGIVDRPEGMIGAGVDTAMQAWIRSQPADEIGAALHQRFQNSYDHGSLMTPEHSVRSLISRLTGDDNGQIWLVDDVRGSHEANAVATPAVRQRHDDHQDKERTP